MALLRTKEALIPYLLLVAALAGGILWHESENVPGLGRTVVSGDATVGGPFTLTDQAGRPVRDGDFRGRYMLIYFGYTFCPDVCPTTLAVMGQALGQMGGDRRIVPVFVTVDPARDTPRVMKAYVRAFGPDFVGLTGSAAAIRAVEKEYKVYAAKTPLDGGGYAMNHSSVIYLVGPDGKLVRFFDGVVSADELAKDLKAAT